MKFIREMIRDLWSSRLSLAGAALVTVSAVLILVAFLLDVLGLSQGQYHGLVAYAFLPVVFMLGLLMIPAGVWAARRRAKRAGAALQPLQIDLQNPAHRRKIVIFLLLTMMNSVILSIALYQGYHYTESTSFCGTVCHTVMEPEYSAYLRSPHARVPCSECHIGQGASWYVKSKLSGLRQVWAVMTGSYSRPVPSPVHDLRPARETCEQCHQPDFFHGNRIVTREQIGAGGERLITAVVLKIGGREAGTGRYTGIHWHVSPENRVEYVASDSRRFQLKRIRSIRPGGEVREFVKESLPEPPAGAEWRVMDCVDCHNRPSHIFEDAERAVDREMVSGAISPVLPGIRELAVQALTAGTAYRDPAKDIKAFLIRHYTDSSPAILVNQGPALDAAAKVLAVIYARNVFPEMKVDFQTHPDHLGHRKEEWGCFRCHDEEHRTSAGRTISQDCGLCHELILQEEPFSKIPEPIRPLIR